MRGWANLGIPVGSPGNGVQCSFAPAESVHPHGTAVGQNRGNFDVGKRGPGQRVQLLQAVGLVFIAEHLEGEVGQAGSKVQLFGDGQKIGWSFSTTPFSSLSLWKSAYPPFSFFLKPLQLLNFNSGFQSLVVKAGSIKYAALFHVLEGWITFWGAKCCLTSAMSKQQNVELDDCFN